MPRSPGASRRRPVAVVLDHERQGHHAHRHQQNLRIPEVVLEEAGDQERHDRGHAAGDERAILRRVDLLRNADRAGEGMIALGRLTIDPLARRVALDGEPIELTVKEYELLLILGRHPGRSFSRAYLLDQVWGDDYEGGDRTVDTHIVRLRRKLGDAGEWIATVWGVGYRLEAEVKS